MSSCWDWFFAQHLDSAREIECRHDIGNGEKAECWKDGEGGERERRTSSSAEPANRAQPSFPNRESPEKSEAPVQNIIDTNHGSDTPKKSSGTKKGKSKREKTKKAKERTRRNSQASAPKDRDPSRSGSNPPSRSPAREPPDKVEREQVSPESDSVSNDDDDEDKERGGGATDSLTEQGNDTAEVPEGGPAEPLTEDKADVATATSSTSSSTTTSTTTTPTKKSLSDPPKDELAEASREGPSSLKDAKSLKDSERLQKELSDASQYPRDALLSRWIEARAGRFGAAPASTSSAQSRPFLTHKLKPSPFQNLMAAQELLKTQKDSERVAGKVTTETSSDSNDSSCTPEGGGQEDEEERETSDDGSEISDDANKTVGSNDCFADDDDDDDDDDTSNEMRIVEDESELRELDLSLPSKHRSEGSMKELQTKSEVKSFDFSVLKSPRAKESKGSSKASLSLDDQNAAACLLQLKSSSTPQSPYVVKILSPEPAHQSGSSTLSAQPMRTPFATRAPPLEAAQPIIPSLGLGESRLVTVSSRGMVEGRGLRPVVPPGPEQAHLSYYTV
ncbi:uncharacterized protein DDB_G0271670-like [Penaeus indicus]|uniref:uncharacterized protein DDB_G0271670-like n=1 Tax=Penaeus indicus TaxID=29960 RepID=UPI00300D8AF0